MITIIDYGMGNVGSIKNMLEFLNFNDVEISSDENTILNSTHVILPGVGSFDEGMKNLRLRNLDTILRKYAIEMGKPLLGICLGMQLLGMSSEEGTSKGLCLADFYCVKITSIDGLRVPHMGWNTIQVINPSCHLAASLDDNSRFYFVHSYHAVCGNSDIVTFNTNYGYDFAVGINQGSVYGVQFHPEKSHHFGMTLLRNFMEI